MTDPPVVQSATYPFRDAADLCAYQEARLWGEPGGQGAEGRRVEYGRYGNPAAAALLARGLTTLGLRVERHNANALRVAEFLEGHPSITRVWYPGLRSHPDHAVARALMLGYGGVVSFEVGDALEDASRFIDATRLPIIAPSLGGADTLIEQPAQMSYYELSTAERLEVGIRDNVVRLAVGIEDADDLIADLDQALGASGTIRGVIDTTFPLVELHRHLDGAIRLSTILDLGLKHNVPLPARDLEGLRPHVQVTEPQPGLVAFLRYFKWLTAVLVDAEACRRIAYENVEDALREGIDHVELRFSPWFMAEPHGLAPEAVVEAVVAGAEAGARDFGVGVRLIGILSRHYGPEIAHRELTAIRSQREHIAALDLAGDEGNWPGSLFVEHFRIARDLGWGITVHAGEGAGPESVWQAIDGLGATRIGHAARAIEDLALVDALAERGIGIEANLTSNVQTSTVPDYASHPLKRFLEAGLLATLNTDDPGISAIDLPYEYSVAAPAAGLSLEQIRAAQRHALALAFLSPDERAALVARKQNDSARA